MKERVFKAREIVFREGDQGSCFYQILEGSAGIYLNYGQKDEQRLTVEKAGQYFGEMAVIDSWPRSSTVVAEEDLRVLEIPENGLNEYFTAQPDKILALMKQLAARIRSLTEEFDEVNAFLRDKETGAAGKKEGFSFRIKKFKAASNLYGKGRNQVSAEDAIRRADLGNSPLPVKSYHAGQVIFREGDPGNYMYAIHGGSVGVYTAFGTALEHKLATLYTNQFFGEMGLIDQEPRSATIVVEEKDTVLECIRAEDLQTLFRENPPEVDMILQHLSRRLRRLTLDYVQACVKAVENV